MASVEVLQEELRGLVAERLAMREREAGRDELESNRLEVALRQRQLSHALIHRHLSLRRTRRGRESWSSSKDPGFPRYERAGGMRT